MAKCVCCTALNSITEAKRHPGFHSESIARILQKRWNDVPKREQRRYCALHSGTGTGRATGEFVPLAAKAKEERAAAAGQ